MNTNSSGGELGMLLTQTNGGTLLSSTRYVHYGEITARSQSSFFNIRSMYLKLLNQLRPAAGQA
jgi:hypothetical protein